MLKIGQRVRISGESGIERKHPSFARAFVGKIGRYIGDVKDHTNRFVGTLAGPHSSVPVSAWCVVDLRHDKTDRAVLLTIPRRWLSAL